MRLRRLRTPCRLNLVRRHNRSLGYLKLRGTHSPERHERSNPPSSSRASRLPQPAGMPGASRSPVPLAGNRAGARSSDLAPRAHRSNGPDPAIFPRPVAPTGRPKHRRHRGSGAQARQPSHRPLAPESSRHRRHLHELDAGTAGLARPARESSRDRAVIGARNNCRVCDENRQRIPPLRSIGHDNRIEDRNRDCIGRPDRRRRRWSHPTLWNPECA